MKWVLPEFIASLLALNPLFIDSDSFQIILKLFEIRLVSSANKIGLDFLLIVLEK
jgi:hypothetical protein